MANSVPAVKKNEQKSILYLSVSSPDNCRQLFAAGCKDILVSYHYIKSQPIYDSELIHQIHEMDGFFMTDSGAFTVFGKYAGQDIPVELTTEEYWLPYIDKYLQWLHDNKKYVYSCANLDLDNFVGRDIVNKWNEKYFKPLEKEMNVIYIAQQDTNMWYNDANGMKRVKEYCKIHDYIGVNAAFRDNLAAVRTATTVTNTKVHGFALTGKEDLLHKPFFSADSSTWLGGARYGTTYINKGNQFYLIDYKNKPRRKQLKMTFSENANYDKFIKDTPFDVNVQNAKGWLDFRERVLRGANSKLRNKPAIFYDRRNK